MTRRALSSKSNSAAGLVSVRWCWRVSGQNLSLNKDFSKSVYSFDLAVFFRRSYGFELCCVSRMQPGYCWALRFFVSRMHFWHHSSCKNRKISIILHFFKNRAVRVSEILLSRTTCLREIKTYLNLGGPAGSLGSWKAATLPTAGTFFRKELHRFLVMWRRAVSIHI